MQRLSCPSRKTSVEITLTVLALLNCFVIASVAGAMPTLGLTGALYLLRNQRDKEESLLFASVFAFAILASMGILFAGDGMVVLLEQAYVARQPLINEAFRIPILDSLAGLFRPFIGLGFLINWVLVGTYLGWQTFSALQRRFGTRPPENEVTDNAG